MDKHENASVTRERVLEALASIAFEESDVKLSERMKALELLGKPLGLWKEATPENTSERESGRLSELLEQLREDREEP